MAKYQKCKKCGKEAMHLATAAPFFYGDWETSDGEISEYADDEAPVNLRISVYTHICYSCGYIEDVWVEWDNDDDIDNHQVIT